MERIEDSDGNRKRGVFEFPAGQVAAAAGLKNYVFSWRFNPAANSTPMRYVFRTREQ